MPDNATLRQGLAMWVQYHMVPKFLKLHHNLFFLNYVNWQDGCYRHVPDKQRPTACTQLCLVSFYQFFIIQFYLVQWNGRHQYEDLLHAFGVIGLKIYKDKETEREKMLYNAESQRMQIKQGFACF